MDVSASTSFESNNGTPDNRTNSYIGDSTLYDSALDHQLSTSAYKSCNDLELSEQQLDFIFREQRHLIRTLSESKPGAEDHDLCMRWLDILRHSTEPEKYARYRLVQEMEHQLTKNGYLGAPFTNPENLDCELEDLLQECSQRQSDNGEVNESGSNSGALIVNGDLREEHIGLQREVNTFKLKVAVLQIEINHQEQQLRRVINDQKDKTIFRNNIKKQILTAAHKALKKQTPELFPSHFLSQIFSPFSGDDLLTQHMERLDSELEEIVQEVCIDSYEVQRQSHLKSINEKVKALKHKLIQKYEKRLQKQEENRQTNAEAMRKKCFIMLKQFMVDNFPDQSGGEEYLRQLETLYERETMHK